MSLSSSSWSMCHDVRSQSAAKQHEIEKLPAELR